MLGAADMVKSGLTAALTVSVTVVEWDSDPPVPMMGIVYVPVLTDPPTVMVI